MRNAECGMPRKAGQSDIGAKAEGRMMNAEKAGKAAQSHRRAKAESRKQKAERRGEAAQSQVQAKCLGGDWEVHAWYMHGTSQVQATPRRRQNGEWRMQKSGATPPKAAPRPARRARLTLRSPFAVNSLSRAASPPVPAIPMA